MATKDRKKDKKYVYSLDIGFNLDLEGNPANGGGEALLSQGFTWINLDGNPVATSRNLKQGAMVKVTIYDLTPEDSNPGVIRDLSFKIKFRHARSQEAKSPVEGGKTFKKFHISPCRWRLGSTVFRETSSLYFLSKGGPKYPRHQLQKNKKPEAVGKEVFELKHTGYFYYTICLDVWLDDVKKPKKFRVDPEMIITTDGGPDGSSYSLRG